MNIGNPSVERAIRQCEWLDQQCFDILILSETKNSKGCKYIYDHFFNWGYEIGHIENKIDYYINYPQSTTGELGVMIISKYKILDQISLFDLNNPFYSRYSQTIVKNGSNKFNIIGLYVPSRNRTPVKIERKSQYISCVSLGIDKLNLKEKTIIAGDFNILDRQHIPHYSTFFKWEYDFYDFFIKKGYNDAFKAINPGKQEYSWIGRTGDGYRYDYIFVTSDLLEKIIRCEFIHETRQIKLTDHSALFLEICI